MIINYTIKAGARLGASGISKEEISGVLVLNELNIMHLMMIRTLRIGAGIIHLAISSLPNSGP